jgi:hypothetical protein
MRASVIAEIAAQSNWVKRQTQLEERLTAIREQINYYRTEAAALRLEITEEQERIEYKQSILPPAKQLVRFKLRLYNMVGSSSTPKGMFQTWWIIDGVMEPDTGDIDRDWWLTLQEIEIAKYHMIGYFKGMAKWMDPSGVGQAYFNERGGISAPDSRAEYARKKSGETYTKNIPPSVVSMAEGMYVDELIVAISSEEPEPSDEPLGVFFERAMVIDAQGNIKWDEIRNKWVWSPTESIKNRVREELGLE